MNRLNQFLATFPSTNGRILLSLLLMLGTGIRVLVSWTAPPWEWLVFLGAALGIDVVQFGMKRATQHNGQGIPPTPS